MNAAEEHNVHTKTNNNYDLNASLLNTEITTVTITKL